MSKSYLIAVDLDGTILNDDKKISLRTQAAIKTAIKQGHVVIISTGRPYRASKMYYDELGLQTPIINFNGALIHHPNDPSWETVHYPLNLDVAKAVIQTCEAFQLKNVIAEVFDTVILKNHVEETINAFSAGEPDVITGDMNQLLKRDPTSLLIHPFAEDVNRLRSTLEECHAEVIEQRVWAAPWHIIEIVRKGLNKAVGVQLVAEAYGIPRERIIAFGDEDNDLEMIDYAGLGVAMGNAIGKIKAIANTITGTNEEDGVAVVIEELLQLR